VIAGWKVVGDLEAGLADQPSVDFHRLGPVLQLPNGGPVRAVLELDPHINRRAVRNVHGHGAGLPGPGDHIRGQDLAPGGQAACLQSRAAAVRRRRVHAKGGEDSGERLGAHRDMAAAPVPVFGGHAVGGGQLAQIVCGFGHSVIQSHMTQNSAARVGDRFWMTKDECPIGQTGKRPGTRADHRLVNGPEDG
jgi:hypothetical protein